MDMQIIIDVSGSMKRELEPGGVSRFIGANMLAVRILNDVKQADGTISLGYFTDEIKTVSSSRNPQVIRKAIEGAMHHMPDGKTRIWDCLSTAVGNADPRNETTIFFITDGGDDRSGRDPDDVLRELASAPRVRLTIIDLSGAMTIHGDGGATMISGNSMEDIEKALAAAPCPAVQRHVSCPASIPLSAAVIPLVDCPASDIRSVLAGIREAVPSIEARTRLRYYPVPTFIVDEAVMIQAGMGRTGTRPADSDLRNDLAEILTFMEAACISFHVGAYSVELGSWDDRYEGCLPHPRSTWHPAMIAAEWICNSLFILVQDDSQRLRALSALSRLFIPGLSRSRRVEDLLRDHFKIITEGLRGVAVKSNQPVTVKDKCFRDMRRRDSGREPSNLEAWKRYLTRRDYAMISRCANAQGIWDKNVESIANAFEVTYKLLLKLLREAQLLADAASPVLQSLRSFGFYVPPAGRGPARLEEELSAHGYPAGSFQDVGRVCLCMNDLRDRMRECGAIPGAPDPAELERRVLLETLLHEHSHAALQEGHDPTDTVPVPPIPGDKLSAIANESLATWSSMDHFRDDPFMRDIIGEHASSGTLPAWPYAGAARIESGGTGIITFRMLLGLTRMGWTQEAGRMIKGMRG